MGNVSTCLGENLEIDCSFQELKSVLPSTDELAGACVCVPVPISPLTVNKISKDMEYLEGRSVIFYVSIHLNFAGNQQQLEPRMIAMATTKIKSGGDSETAAV